jgi:regulator of replication initiation timing
MALTGSGENINKQLQAENEHLKKLIGELTIANDAFKKHWKQG